MAGIKLYGFDIHLIFLYLFTQHTTKTWIKNSMASRSPLNFSSRWIVLLQFPLLVLMWYQLPAAFYIHITIIILPIEKSSNIFKSFIRTSACFMPVTIVQWHAEIFVFNVTLNVKNLKLKYRRSIYFLKSCYIYIMSCLFLLICACDTELNPGPPKEILFMIFHLETQRYCFS